jgi:hypothetical protein
LSVSGRKSGKGFPEGGQAGCREPFASGPELPAREKSFYLKYKKGS